MVSLEFVYTITFVMKVPASYSRLGPAYSCFPEPDASINRMQPSVWGIGHM